MLELTALRQMVMSLLETWHDSVYDVLVNKKSKAMLVFILFSTEENLVTLISCISFHGVQGCSIGTCPFRVLVPGVSLQLLGSCVCACVCVFLFLLFSFFLFYCRRHLRSSCVGCSVLFGENG